MSAPATKAVPKAQVVLKAGPPPKASAAAPAVITAAPTVETNKGPSDRVRVVISGAGPAGLLAAHLLLDRSERYHVTLLERGINFARESLVINRSWVIGLSSHGLEATKAVPGLYEKMKGMGIQGKGAKVHFGKTVMAQTSVDVEGYFVDRNWICAAQLDHLLNAYGESPRLKTEFQTRVLAVDSASKVVIAKSEDGSEKRFEYDVLLGCDGVRSAVRDAFLRKYDFEFNLEDIFSRIKHMHVDIPTKMCNQSFHVVFGCFGSDGLGGVALPELDAENKPTKMNIILGSYAHQIDNFPAVLHGNDAHAVAEFLRTGGGLGCGLGHIDFDFEDLGKQFVSQGWSRISRCHCNYYHLTDEKILLMGDAAHATAPSLGQGMNTAMADARVLNDLLNLYQDNWDLVLPAFTRTRVKEGHALTDLSTYQFSMDIGQQLSLTLQETMWKAVGYPNPMMEVPKGTKLSKVYDVMVPRTDAVRQTNDTVVRSWFERSVGLVKPRPGRTAPMLKLFAYGSLVYAVWMVSVKWLAVGLAGLCLARSYKRAPLLPVTKQDRALAEKGLKLPGVVKLISKLPTSMKKAMLLQAPPENLPDSRDVDGSSPFEFLDVVPGKVGLAIYKYQPDPAMSKLSLSQVCGCQAQQKILSGADTDEEKALLKKDFEKVKICADMKDAEIKKGGWLKHGYEMRSTMVVLTTSNGGLLLYSPVKVDDECKAWLDKLGRVDYIVSPSSNHTLFVKSAALQYPKAKVIASEHGACKLSKAGVKTDILYDGPASHLAALKEALSSDFEIYPLAADPLCEFDLLHKSTGTLCVCDLLYAQTPYGLLEKEDAMHPDKWMGRMFQKANFDPNFGNGLMPIYRHGMLDPNSGFPQVTPADSSTMEKVGTGIMKLISLPGVERLCSAHLRKPLQPEEARQMLAASWCWVCEEAIGTHTAKGAEAV